jgi:hypothetical protein
MFSQCTNDHPRRGAVLFVASMPSASTPFGYFLLAAKACQLLTHCDVISSLAAGAVAELLLQLLGEWDKTLIH